MKRGHASIDFCSAATSTRTEEFSLCALCAFAVRLFYRKEREEPAKEPNGLQFLSSSCTAREKSAPLRSNVNENFLNRLI